MKLVLIADPGVDAALAIALATHDPHAEVVGLLATAGNVSAERATRNVQFLVAHLDPPRWPQVGAAPPIPYDIDGRAVHGIDGFAGLSLPTVSLHQPTASDKVLVELARQHPGEITCVVLGPATVLALAIDRDPALPDLLDRIVLAGGMTAPPGDASLLGEFHFSCDPVAAQAVLRSGASVSVVPLDQCRRLVYSPGEWEEMPATGSAADILFRQIVPPAAALSSTSTGIEGVTMGDVVALCAATRPGLLRWAKAHAEVETRGEFTRGVSLIETRAAVLGGTNCAAAVDADVEGIRAYVREIWGRMRAS